MKNNSNEQEAKRNKDVQFVDVYKLHEFDALKLQYETQTSLLRYLTDIDLRIFTGYITMQLLLAGWLTQNSVDNLILQVGIFLIDIALTWVAWWLLSKSSLRREEVAAIIWNLNDALGYTKPDVYLKGKALKVTADLRLWIRGYRFALIIATLGVGIIVFQDKIKLLLNFCAK